MFELKYPLRKNQPLKRPLLRRIATNGAAVVMTLNSTLATAGPPGPELNPLNDGKVAHVIPVLAAGGEVQWSRLASSMESGTHAPTEHGAMIRESPRGQTLSKGAGFGFAGAATSSDVDLLQYGYLLGLIPTRLAVGQQTKAIGMAQKLARQKTTLATLDLEAQRAVAMALEAAERGALSGEGFAAVLRAASEGSNGDGARAHGYLMAGVWSGLASLAAIQEGLTHELVGMSAPIITYLERDAAVGSTDHQIAAAIRSIAHELHKEHTDLRRVISQAKVFFALQAD